MSAAASHRWLVLPMAAAQALLIVACARAGRAEAPAVTLNGEEIPYSQFESYLRASFGDNVPPGDDAETLSRLLDQFIEERLLLQRAERERLTVGEEQVDAFLAGLGSGPRSSGKEDAAIRDQVRRNLLIEAFKDRILLKDLEVSPDEVEAYFREHPAEFQQSQVIVLRQILLEDPAEARRIAAELKQDPARFPLLAQRASLSPDKGQPRPFQEEELPEQVRHAVLRLSPGQVSEEVAEGGKIRFFQMVDRREAKAQSLDEVRRGIEVLLLQRKAETVLAGALQEARRDASVKVHRASLPFTYQGEMGG